MINLKKIIFLIMIMSFGLNAAIIPNARDFNPQQAAWSLVSDNCLPNRDDIYVNNIAQTYNIKEMALEGLAEQILSGGSAIFDNYDGMDALCKVKRYEECSNPAKMMNVDKLNAEIKKCVGEAVSGSIMMDTKAEVGTSTFGCWVTPGARLATFPPVFPFVANPYNPRISAAYMASMCWCGPVPCPYGTIRIGADANTDIGVSVDISKAASIGTCMTSVQDDIIGDQYSQCVVTSEANCKNTMKSKIESAQQKATQTYNQEQEKCKIKLNAIIKKYKDSVNEKLENVKLPNMKRIVNGKIEDIDNKGSNTYVFEVNDNDLPQLTNRMSNCESEMPQIENKTEFESLQKWCQDFSSNVNSVEKLDKWIVEEVDDISYEDSLKVSEYKIKKINEINENMFDIKNDRYIEGRKYDKDKLIQYSEESPETIEKFNSILEDYDYAYDKNINKYNNIISQKYEEIRKKKETIRYKEKERIKKRKIRERKKQDNEDLPDFENMTDEQSKEFFKYMNKNMDNR